MLNRRLVVLFILFAATMVVLGLRLGQLQLVQADQWRQEARSFIHRHRVLETSRGAIIDRNGQPIARDEPCYDLAIDYRAMNLDDRWITRAARLRLREQKFTGTRAEFARRLADERTAIADQIDAIPDEVAKKCNMSVLQVRSRFNEIRARIRALRQDRWSNKFVRGDEAQDTIVPTDDELQKEVHDETVAHTIVPAIPDDIAFYFRQNATRLPGLVVIDAKRREYLYNDVACHVIGALRNVDDVALKAGRFDLPNLLSDSDAGNLHGYLPGDNMGEFGIERFAENTLRGTRGVRLTELGADAPSKQIDPVPGRDVQLTLDIKLQHDVQQALLDPNGGLTRGQDGAVHHVALLVLNMRGEVLLMISLPSYDLNQLDQIRTKLMDDERDRPLVNRATAAVYTPGSTIKPLIAAGALTEKLITPNDTITCNGHLFPNRPGMFRCDYYVEYGLTHGPLHLNEALEKSCNIYFFTLGERLGLERLTHWFDLFGLGSNTGIEVPEQDGVLPPKSLLADPQMAKAESIFLGIGQGHVNATLLQIASAYATLLRNGQVVQPHLLAATTPASQQKFTLAPGTLAAIEDGLNRVPRTGTARKAFAGMKMSLGGKTGTADTERDVYDDYGNPLYDDPPVPLLDRDGHPRLDRDGKPLYRRQRRAGADAWFVGYVPAQQPQYVVAAIMEFGGHGGTAAAPMVRETILQMEKHGYLPKLDVP